MAPIQRLITDDLEELLACLPPHLKEPLDQLEDRKDLLEVVLDLGRLPEARFLEHEVVLNQEEVAQEEIDYVVARIGVFGDDNRAGIERTLHRISAIRNRSGRIVGLTCRVGRAVFGTINIIEDLVQSGQSLLLMGRPGVGKTTMLREVARVLADDLGKRVVIVDTSNEIAGDGDIPHPAIGRARRMQVATPSEQHSVMIEAVENHMPEVIIIDEIGTELEAQAARTIAERGVQLVGTAHGNTLENLMMNPTLSDLIGGIQTVTLGDDEARRRGTQKSILERKAPPTFDVVVEIQSWDQVAVHDHVAEVVDSILRGPPLAPEVRLLDEDGHVVQQSITDGLQNFEPASETENHEMRVLPFGVSRSRLQQAISGMNLSVTIVDQLEDADVLMTLRNYYRRKLPAIRDAEERSIPVYVLKNNTIPQMEQCLASIVNQDQNLDPLVKAMQETETAIGDVLNSRQPVDLSPQNAYIRKLQHQMAERYNLASKSRGKEPYRRVRISGSMGR